MSNTDVEHIKIRPVSPKTQYVGNGRTREFQTVFAFFAEDNIVVYLNDKIISSGFKITGVGNSEGGTVTFDVAPKKGENITIIRDIVIERITDFQEGGTFRAKNINDEFDRLTAVSQQVNEVAKRAIVFPPFYAGEYNSELPRPEAKKALVWNDSGTALRNSAVDFDQVDADTKQYRDEALAARDAAKVSEDNAKASENVVVAKVDGFDARVDEATNTFDRNYNDKLVAFNINAVDKQNAFDVNAATLTARYDNNDLAKTKAFNENAKAMTDGFNTNAMLKIDDFDANVAIKEMEYNDNADAKISEYNANDVNKTKAYNDNATAKQAQVDASASMAKQSELNAKTSEDNAQIWAEGTDAEVGNLGGEKSAKGWAEAAGEIVGKGIIQDGTISLTTTYSSKKIEDKIKEVNANVIKDDTISLTTTYSSDKLEKHFAVNEDHDSVLNCLDVLNDTIGEKTTVPLSSLQAIDADSRPSHKAPGAEVYDEFGTMGIIDSVTASDAIITTMESREKVRIVDTLDIQKNGLDQYYVALTANEIRNEVNKGKIVQLRFDDVITNTGEQLYPFETMDKQGYAVFRRNVITKDKAERINIKVDYQGIVTFETAELNALLKSGGSMSGALKFDNSGYIEANNSSATKGLALFGSKDGYGNGASLSLRDNTATGEQAGEFKLETGNNITGHTHTFRGHPDGKLYWDNKELANKEFITSKITNCITEIPQDIKLELKDGTLTLKAGSKLYKPDSSFIITSVDKKLGAQKYDNPKLPILYLLDNNSIATATKMATVEVKPTAKGDYTVYFVTSENKVYWDEPLLGWRECALPLGLTSRNSSVGYYSIDQVFNGFGYIGSTVYALPGVKGLVPDGRNADGSLKNIEMTLDKVVTRNLSGSLKQYLFVNKTSFRADAEYFYDEASNILLDASNTVISRIFMGNVITDNGRITSFNTKQVFHALDYNDKSVISGWSAPSDKFIFLNLGVNGATYIAPANGYFYLSTVGKDTWMYNLSSAEIAVGANTANTDAQIRLNITVKKGDTIRIDYVSAKVNEFRFIYAEGEK